jgi:hypothetical protein
MLDLTSHSLHFFPPFFFVCSCDVWTNSNALRCDAMRCAVVTGFVALFSASTPATGEQFRAYSQTVGVTARHLFTISWHPFVPHALRAQFELDLKRQVIDYCVYFESSDVFEFDRSSNQYSSLLCTILICVVLHCMAFHVRAVQQFQRASDGTARSARHHQRPARHCNAGHQPLGAAALHPCGRAPALLPGAVHCGALQRGGRCVVFVVA